VCGCVPAQGRREEGERRPTDKIIHKPNPNLRRVGSHTKLCRARDYERASVERHSLQRQLLRYFALAHTSRINAAPLQPDGGCDGRLVYKGCSHRYCGGLSLLVGAKRNSTPECAGVGRPTSANLRCLRPQQMRLVGGIRYRQEILGLTRFSDKFAQTMTAPWGPRFQRPPPGEGDACLDGRSLPPHRRQLSLLSAPLWAHAERAGDNMP
jgi:hypothetical protein